VNPVFDPDVESADGSLVMSESNSYARTQILTAAPHQLRGLVLKHAVQEARQLAELLAQGDGEQILSCGSRLRALVLELIPEPSDNLDAELLARLRSIGVYLYKRIGIACSQRDPVIASEVMKLLMFEQETWNQAMDRLQVDPPESMSPGRTNLAG